MDPSAYLDAVEVVLERGPPDLSPLAAGVLVAAHFDLAGDSRSFAKIFGLAHALTLRAVAQAEIAGLIQVVRCDARIQRKVWRLAPAGQALVEAGLTGSSAREATTLPEGAVAVTSQLASASAL